MREFEKKLGAALGITEGRHSNKNKWSGVSGSLTLMAHKAPDPKENIEIDIDQNNPLDNWEDKFGFGGHRGVVKIEVPESVQQELNKSLSTVATTISKKGSTYNKGIWEIGDEESAEDDSVFAEIEIEFESSGYYDSGDYNNPPEGEDERTLDGNIAFTIYGENPQDGWHSEGVLSDKASDDLFWAAYEEIKDVEIDMNHDRGDY